MGCMDISPYRGFCGALVSLFKSVPLPLPLLLPSSTPPPPPPLPSSSYPPLLLPSTLPIPKILPPISISGALIANELEVLDTPSPVEVYLKVIITESGL